jgi:hypothetical protein
VPEDFRCLKGANAKLVTGVTFCRAPLFISPKETPVPKLHITGVDGQRSALGGRANCLSLPAPKERTPKAPKADTPQIKEDADKLRKLSALDAAAKVLQESASP